MVGDPSACDKRISGLRRGRDGDVLLFVKYITVQYGTIIHHSTLTTLQYYCINHFEIINVALSASFEYLCYISIVIIKWFTLSVQGLTLDAESHVCIL